MITSQPTFPKCISFHCFPASSLLQWCITFLSGWDTTEISPALSFGLALNQTTETSVSLCSKRHYCCNHVTQPPPQKRRALLYFHQRLLNVQNVSLLTRIKPNNYRICFLSYNNMTHYLLLRKNNSFFSLTYLDQAIMLWAFLNITPLIITEKCWEIFQRQVLPGSLLSVVISFAESSAAEKQVSGRGGNKRTHQKQLNKIDVME